MTIAQQAVLDRIAVGERRAAARLIGEVTYCSPDVSMSTAQQAILNLARSGHFVITDHFLVERVK